MPNPVIRPEIWENSDVDNGGGPPHNGSMDTRLTKLETQFETVIPTLATKVDIGDVRSEISSVRAEIHKSTSDIVKWIVGTALAMFALGLTIMTFVLNNATPKAQTPQAAPIIIAVPTPAPAQNTKK